MADIRGLAHCCSFFSNGVGCLEISFAGIDHDIAAGEVSVFHGSSVKSLNGIFASGKMYEAPGAGEDVVPTIRKDSSRSCAYSSPEFWTAYRYVGDGMGVVIVAALPPTDHDAQRGVIYRIPRKKGSKQWAVHGGGWRFTSVFLIKGYHSNCRMRSDDPDGVQPPACLTFWLDQLVVKMPADDSTTKKPRVGGASIGEGSTTATGSSKALLAEADDGHRPIPASGQRDDGHRGTTATGPAIMEVDSADSRAAIERDLRCYADQWQNLQDVEADSAYGPVYPEPADVHELSRKGTCIHDVTLRRGMDFPPPFRTIWGDMLLMRFPYSHMIFQIYV